MTSIKLLNNFYIDFMLNDYIGIYWLKNVLLKLTLLVYFYIL